MNDFANQPNKTLADTENPMAAALIGVLVKVPVLMNEKIRESDDSQG